MSFVRYNANPYGRETVDCTVRAIAVFLDSDWDTQFARLSVYAFMKKDMLMSDRLWLSYLRSLGFRPREIPDTCPWCYTVRDFCMDHPFGRYLLATEGHVVAVVNGNYYDIWDSGNEIPLFYLERR